MSFPTPGQVPRPGGVTAVVIVTWVAALLDMIGGGALWLLSRSQQVTDAVDVTAAEMRGVGIGIFAVGVIVALVATSLSTGSRFARMLVTILMVLRLIGAAVTLVLLGASGILEAAVAAVLSIVVLRLLWNRTAQEYFHN